MSQIDPFQDLIDIKCISFSCPKPNYIYTPLNGLYEPININTSIINNTDDSNNKKIKISNLIQNDNLFILNENINNVLLQDTFKALLVVYKRPRETVGIAIQNILINIRNEPNPSEMFPKHIDNKIEIKEFSALNYSDKYSYLISQIMETTGKYIVDITVSIQIEIREILNNKENYGKQNKNNIQYIDRLYKKDYKAKFGINSSFPFKIREINYRRYQMKQYQIEINISNITNIPLNIFEIYLFCYKKNNIKLYPQNIIKNFVIQNKEELNILFNINNEDLFKIKECILIIEWSNLFDTKTKYFKQLMKNEIFNKKYNLILEESPDKNITYGNIFKVVFKLENKTDKKLNLEIIHQKNFKKVEREVEIIDIVDNKIELINDAKFCLICKSNIIGPVSLPSITIINKSINEQQELKNLLYFDCIE